MDIHRHRKLFKNLIAHFHLRHLCPHSQCVLKFGYEPVSPFPRVQTALKTWLSSVCNLALNVAFSSFFTENRTKARKRNLLTIGGELWQENCAVEIGSGGWLRSPSTALRHPPKLCTNRRQAQYFGDFWNKARVSENIFYLREMQGCHHKKTTYPKWKFLLGFRSLRWFWKCLYA